MQRLKSILVFVIKYFWLPVVGTIVTVSLPKLLVPVAVATAAYWVLIVALPYFKGLKERLVFGSDFSQFILRRMLAEDPRVIDTIHHYTLIRVEAFVTADGSYEATYRYAGYNRTNKASEFLTLKTNAESPVRLAQMNMRAVDLLTGNELHIDLVSDNNFEKIVRIRFRSAVEPGQAFNVLWAFVWPHCMRMLTTRTVLLYRGFAAVLTNSSTKCLFHGLRIIAFSKN